MTKNKSHGLHRIAPQYDSLKILQNPRIKNYRVSHRRISLVVLNLHSAGQRASKGLKIPQAFIPQLYILTISGVTILRTYPEPIYRFESAKLKLAKED
jgi:hypothetical protein